MFGIESVNPDACPVAGMNVANSDTQLEPLFGQTTQSSCALSRPVADAVEGVRLRDV